MLFFNLASDTISITQKIETKENVRHIARVTKDLMILTSFQTYMLFDISNNTMISTLDSEFMISDIKKINSLLFA